ncbi:hypothetical protein LIER_23234 [Lithospermum erythrorhizon]|uniref:Reverse transcriptase domain-containing protein n=1 Tax=Lithospermum erythrorhizon TaxID=34254 RepID=A0AAV3QY79_LITER
MILSWHNLPSGDSASIFEYGGVEEEIQQAFLSMAAWKSLGPDGHILPILNATTLSLISKVEHPKDYIPISCCNNIYKAITKILMGRMSSFMPMLVSPSQSTFVRGRCIANSILMLQELVQRYHN